MSKKLNRVYKMIPEIKCPDGCTLCCAPVKANKEEKKILNLKSCNTGWTGHHECEFMVPGVGCSVYDKRPMICRLFGTAESGAMSCSRVLSGDFISENLAALVEAEYMVLRKGYHDPKYEEAALIHDMFASVKVRGNKADTTKSIMSKHLSLVRRYYDPSKEENRQ